MSNNKKKTLYTAVVLNAESKDKIIKALASKIPEGWVIFAHHMTIVFGKGLEDKSQVGKEVSLVATQLGFNGLAMAVKAEGYPTSNKIPHITIAVNKADGGKPFNSNQIEKWENLGELIELRGVITEVTN